MAIDEELGFDPQQAYEATEQLRQPIQNILNNFDLPVVCTALAEAFFGCLKMAGASDWDVDKWAKKLLRIVGHCSSNSVQSAYDDLSQPINKMIQEEDFGSLAIAYSLIGAIVSVMRQHPAVSDKKADELMENLLMHINQVQ